MRWRNPWRSLKGRMILVTSSLWLVSLWGLTFTVSGWLLADLRALLSRNQESTAAIVADHLSDQLSERTEALRSLAAQTTPALLADPAALQAFLEDKPVLLGLFNAGAYITDAQGTAVASIPHSAGRLGRNYFYRNHVQAALTQGISSPSEIVIGQALKTPVFSIAVPIRDAAGHVVACLAGVIDLTLPNFLDNLTNNRLGETGGYLLVERNQRLVITATDKRRIMEQLAAPGVHPQIDAFLKGEEGSQILVNPRKVEVLVAAHQVSGAPWYVAAAIPTAEVFRPARVLMERMLLMAFLLTLFTGFLNWLFLRRELSPILSTIRTLSSLTDSSGPIPPLEVHRRDEIGDLIEGFNRLLGAVAERERERSRYETLLSRSQRLEALGLLAGGIAHDFNNLLAGVFGNIELALLKTGDGPGTPQLRKTLGILNRARSLTQQLITFSKGGDPDLKTGHLFPFVEETVKFALSGSAVSCRFEVAERLRPCRFDRNQLGQVIDNLVINAHQAMPEGGALVVTAQNTGTDEAPTVTLSIADTGPGMPPEVQEHLFEPFFSTKVGGHGLGLTTCYSIVRKHGGVIEVESELGRGTTFHIHLPAAEGAENAEVEAATAPHRGQGTILIMDDEPHVGEVLAEMLASFGYRVLCSESGAQAIEALVAEQAAGRSLTAAILDLTIPGGMGGQETLEHLHRLDPGLKALVSSGFTAAPVLADPVSYGFAAALRKPYQRADLEQALNIVLKT